MTRFRYRAYDANGAVVEGELPASTRERALTALAGYGYRPFELDASEAAPTPWWRRELFEPAALSLPQIAIFTRELASLVAAQLPLDEALRIVAMQPMMPRRLKDAAGAILARVVEGDSLSDALRAQGAAFPTYYWRLVKAGESAGALQGALTDLADFLERSAADRGRIKSALTYPAILVAASLATVGVILAVLVPAIAPLFAEAGAKPPGLIGALVATETFIRAYGAALAIAATALIAIAVLAMRRDATRAAIDRRMLSAPVAGRLIEQRETARLARTLAMLIKNGVPIVEATRTAGDVLTNRALREAVAQASGALRQGQTLTAPLARSGLFSDLFLRLTAIGEKTGDLHPMLERVADIYDAALARQIDRLTTMIAPAATLVIGLVVGGLILSVMSALLSMNDLALK